MSEKEKFAAMLAQREDTGYNWREHWRINSEGVCMTAKMRNDRETTNRPLNTMDEMAYRELEAENKKLKKRAEEAEGETTIVKGIGLNSPEMRALHTENKNLKNSLGDAADKMTVLQLKCDKYEIMRLTVLKSLQEMKEIINESDSKAKEK